MAPFYNKITNIISEGGNIRSQRYFLTWIKKSTKVLNIGCGSVAFNVDLARKSKHVTSIDISDKMIEIAKKSIAKHKVKNNVKFLCMDIMDYTSKENYDVVFANFMLNTFEWEYAVEVLKYITSFVKEDGILCIADEEIAKKKLQRFTQKLCRPFISWVHHIWAGHPMHKIYDYRPVLEEYGFMRVAYKIDKSGVISSSVYQKQR